MAWLSAGAASATAVDAASLWSPTISTAGVSCAAAAAGRGATIIAAVSSLYFQVDINGFLTLLDRLLSSRFSPSFSTISTYGRRPRSEERRVGNACVSTCRSRRPRNRQKNNAATEENA